MTSSVEPFFFLFALLINIFILQKTSLVAKLEEAKNQDLVNDEMSLTANRQYCQKLFIWFNLLAVPTALSHEAILFLSIPINMIITLNVISLILPLKPAIFRSLMIYSPTILVAVISYLWSGNESIARGICESWQPFELSQLDCQGELPLAFKYLGWSLQDALTATGRIFTSKINIWLTILTLNTIVLLRASSKIIANSIENYKPQGSKQDLSLSSARILASFSVKYAMIPFVCSLPLYVLAMDWGRWYFIIAISYVICLLSPALIHLEIINNYRDRSRVSGLFQKINSDYTDFLAFLLMIVQRFYPVYLLFFIYTLLLTRIPHYAIRNKDLYGGLVNLFWSQLNR